MNILIVEDESWHRKAIGDFLAQSGHQVRCAETISEADEYVKAVELPDLIILDWMLPDGSGLEFMARIRESGYQGWILMLTARSDSQSIVKGLDAGADDYITKPFRLRELSARIEASERRIRERGKGPETYGYLKVGDLVMDREFHKISSADGTPLDLSRLESSMLLLLMTRYPDSVSKLELKAEVWGKSFSGADGPLYSVAHRIRQKMEDAEISNICLEMVYGKGYCLVDR